MATKRPLVLNAGIIQQIASGDTLIGSANTEASLFDATGNLGQLAAASGTGFYARNATGGAWSARTIEGTENVITVNSGDGVAGNPTITIASTYAGQSSIVTVGTLTSGAIGSGFTTIGTAFGGTGQSTYASGEILIGNASGSLTKTTLTQGSGITITNGDGSIAIANNGVVSLTSTASTITVTNTGVDYNIDLPDVNVAGALSAPTFVKVALDAQGRVLSHTAVTTSDITALVDNTYVNVSGDTMTGNLDFGGTSKVTGLAAPTEAGDAANKQYVDSVAQGLDVKGSVRAATTSNITLSGLQTVDGVSLVAGDRVLVKNQDTASQNGIYLVVDGGAWTRATDLDNWAEVPGAFTFVEEGTVNADTGWVSTANQGGTIDTTPMPWTQFSGAGTYLAGTGLTLDGNTFNVNGGAGITAGTDDVTVDLHADGALFTTEDGTTPSASAAAQLAVKLDGSTLSRTSSGLKVAQQSGLTVLGVSGTTTADVAAISGTAGQVLRVASDGSSLGFGALDLGQSGVSVTGVLDIAFGGTGANNKTDAFDNLAPTSVKGQLIVHDGTDNVALNVGTSNQILAVNTAGDDVAYKSIVAGNGITVDHTDSSITITGTGAVENFNAINTGVEKNAALYATSAGNEVGHALATSGSTANVVGIALEAGAGGASVPVAVAGIVTGDNWATIAGSATLTPGATYWLSAATPGRLTTTPPSGNGEYVTMVGIAMTTTKLKLVLAPTIALN